MTVMGRTEISEFIVDATLASELSALLRSGDLSGGRLDTALSSLVLTHRANVFTELIHLLTHLRFAPEVAEDLWRRVVEHRRRMEDGLGASVDPRVALISYLVDVTPMLDNPKVVEMDVFYETRDRAYRDALTGLRNFRFFSEYLAHEVAGAEQDDSPVSLTMIDLDNFKSFNDRYGHEAGNRALAMVARVLNECVRPSDILARFGGEEFAVVLPSTQKQGALVVAEKLRRAVEECKVRAADGSLCGGLTISVGVATAPADAESCEDLVRRADAAMYAAKSAGKNVARAYGDSVRSFPRFPAILRGTFAVGVSNRRSLTTVNVSPRGMLIRVDDELPVGAVIDARLQIPSSRGEVQLLGRVVSARTSGDGLHEARIRIVEIPGAGRKELKDYLRDSATRVG